MAFLTPEQKRDHFRDRRKMPQRPEAVERPVPLTNRDILAAERRMADEVALARRLGQAYRTTLARANQMRDITPGTAREMRKAAAQHRRLWWYAAFAAVRELGAILAATNEWDALSYDEAGADLDVDARRLLEWLVDEGRATRSRKVRQ